MISLVFQELKDQPQDLPTVETTQKGSMPMLNTLAVSS